MTSRCELKNTSAAEERPLGSARLLTHLADLLFSGMRLTAPERLCPLMAAAPHKRVHQQKSFRHPGQEQPCWLVGLWKD